MTSYSKVDRKKVLDVNMDMYSRMIRGVLDLVLIAKLMDKVDYTHIQAKYAAELERIGKDIEECDKNIESEEWLGRWKDDAELALGDTGIGKRRLF